LQSAVIVGVVDLEMGLDEVLAEHVQVAASSTCARGRSPSRLTLTLCRGAAVSMDGQVSPDLTTNGWEQ
jgi:hypothetical protein